MEYRIVAAAGRAQTTVASARRIQARQDLRTFAPLCLACKLMNHFPFAEDVPAAFRITRRNSRWTLPGPRPPGGLLPRGIPRWRQPTGMPWHRGRASAKPPRLPRETNARCRAVAAGDGRARELRHPLRKARPATAPQSLCVAWNSSVARRPPTGVARASAYARLPE